MAFFASRGYINLGVGCLCWSSKKLTARGPVIIDVFRRGGDNRGTSAHTQMIPTTLEGEGARGLI